MGNDKNLDYLPIGFSNALTGRIHIKLNEQKEYLGRDVKDHFFSGTYYLEDRFGGNFSNCVFHETQIENCNFDVSDFRNCIFVNSTFRNCILGGGTYSSCQFYNCLFEKSSLRFTSFFDLKIFQTDFEEVDVERVMFRQSELIETNFTKCSTSNKVFEDSILLDCNFSETELDIDIIISNYGLSVSDVDIELIRKNRTFPESKFVSKNDFNEYYNSLTEDLEILKVDFFKKTQSNEIIDFGFSLSEIARKKPSNSSFQNELKNLSKFVSYKYQTDKLELFTILKLVSQVDKEIESGQLNHIPQLTSELLMIKLRLEEILSEEIRLIERLNLLTENPIQIKFITEDNVTDEKIYSILSKLGIPVSSVISINRNSPAEIILIAGASAIAIRAFAFFRFRFEIKKLCAENPIFSFTIGSNKIKSKNQEVSLQTQVKSITVGFDLLFSSKKVSAEFRVWIKRVLSKVIELL